MKTKSWQTLTAAAKQAGCTRQNISALAKAGKIRCWREFGIVLVPHPLRYTVDKKRQKLAKDNA